MRYPNRTTLTIARHLYGNLRQTLLNPHSEVNIYAPQLNLVYVAISKTGTSSIKSLLLDRIGAVYDVEDYNSIHRVGHGIFQYITKQQVLALECFKFSFVRNPFDRLASCYINKIINENYPPIQLGYGRLFYKGMPFEKFAKRVCQIPDALSDRHFRSQSSYLLHNGKHIVDYIGKFENLQQDFQFVMEKYQLARLPCMNASAPSDGYSDFFTRKLVEMVANRYRQDIAAFGYQHEYEALFNRVNHI